MKRYTCQVESCGSIINFVSSVDLYPNLCALAKDSYIPDMRVTRAAKIDNTPRLVYVDSPHEENLVFSAGEVIVRYPWEMMRDGESLLYLSYPLIEVQRQLQGDLTAHAACISIDNRGVLLLGKEGSGKTTLAIELCQKHSARLVANDLCILGERQGNIIARGGTKFFFLRRESISRNLPRLLHLFPTASGDSWLDKTKVDHTQLGVETEDRIVNISNAFMLHVDETKTELHTCFADTLVTRLYLNENFSRYIRSTCTVMTGGSNFELLGYIPSLDCEEFYKMRKQVIKGVLNSSPQYISGPVHLVADYIANLQRHG
ncbi:MAG: hypothetical protein NTZ65_04875 [Candidatus Berkelbacteria bacterium]|nr:hypothetical protein [Candidatus Berkelbacteria bacterium]